MGLFDMFKKKAEPAAAAAPASISASAGADVLCSPVKGKVIKMADVPDPVSGQGLCRVARGRSGLRSLRR